MHAELHALLDEHASPTHASKADIRALMRPLAKVCAKAQLQAVHYRGLLADAQYAPHESAIDGKLNGMKQALIAVDKAASDFQNAASLFQQSGERLADAFSAIDRYLTHAKADLARYDAAKVAAKVAT